MNYIKYFILLLFTLGSSIAFSQNCSVNAGGNVTICGTTHTLAGSAGGNTNGAPTWTIVSKPAGAPDPVISDINSYTPDVTDLDFPGTYVFEISQPCGTGTVTSQVTITAPGDVSTFTAGPDITNISATVGTVTLNAVVPEGYTIQWSAYNIYQWDRSSVKTDQNSQFSSTTTATTTFSLIKKADHDIDPAYVVTARITSTLNPNCWYEDTITVRFVPSPYIIVNDKTECKTPNEATQLTSLSLNNLSPIFSKDFDSSPNSSGNFGTTISLIDITQPTGADIVYENLWDARLRFSGVDVPGTYKFKVRVSNSLATFTTPEITYSWTGVSPSYGSFMTSARPIQKGSYGIANSGAEVHCDLEGTNTPLTIHFTLNPVDDPAQMTTTVTNSGITAAGGVPTLSAVNGTGANRSVTVTPPSGGWHVGTYRIIFSSTYGSCEVSQSYYIHISDSARPDVNVPNTTICYPGSGSVSATIPLPDVYKGVIDPSYLQDYSGRYRITSVSIPSGAATPIIPNPQSTPFTNTTTTISNLDREGEYVFKIEAIGINSSNQWIIDDEYACSDAVTEDTFSIFVSTQVNANAGSSQSISCPLAATVTMNGNNPGVASTGEWTITSKPAGAPDPIFSDATLRNTEVSGFGVGEYILRWTITTGDCISFDETTITVSDLDCPAPGGVTGVDFWIKSDDAGDITMAWKDHSANLDDIPAVGADWALSPADGNHNFHPYTTGYANNRNFYNPESMLNPQPTGNTYGASDPMGHSIFSAVRPTIAANGRITGIDDSAAEAAEPGVSITSNGSARHYEFLNTSTSNDFSTPFNIGSTNIFSAIADNAVEHGGSSTFSGGEKRLGLNGTYELFTFDNNNRFQLVNQHLRVGHGTHNVNGAFPGDIMEVIWYKRALTENEQSRVNAYLAIKNGVTLSEDYLSAASTVVFDQSTNEGYTDNIFGIAKDDASALHQKQAKSVNPNQQLIIGAGSSLAEANADNPNSLTDGQFLIVGDNDLSQSLSVPLIYTGGTNGETNMRFASIWKTQNTGNVGTVTVAWPKGVENLYLVQSSDDVIDLSDDFVPMTAEVTIGGVVYNTATVTLGSYFTFAGFGYAPGGVTNALSYWYRADIDAENTGEGTDVTGWTDVWSGTTVAQLGSNNFPKYAEGAADYFNFNPGINFTANTQTLGNISVQTLTSLNYDIFTLTKEGMSGLRFFNVGRDNITFSGSNWDSPAFQTDGRIVRRTSTGAGPAYWANPGNTFITEIPSIAYTTFTDVNLKRGVNGSPLLGPGSNHTAIGAVTGGHMFGRNSGTLTLGDDAGFVGHIGETIVYGAGNLSGTERRRVDTYLAIKYGITLGRVETDHYLDANEEIVWNGTVNEDYNYNIFGVAREDIGAFQQKISSSINTGSILTVATVNDFVSPNLDGNRTGFTNDQTYFLLGDNNIADIPTEDIEIDGENYKRIQRVWLSQRQNTPGDLHFQADLSAYGVDFSVMNDVVMVIADDENFITNVRTVSGVQQIGKWIHEYNFDADTMNQYITYAVTEEQCLPEFVWSSPVVASGNTAIGTIDGIEYAYTSSSPVLTSPAIFDSYNVFPVSTGSSDIFSFPRTAHSVIRNTQVTSNTITFDEPVTDPVLIFSSIGGPAGAVPVVFGQSIEVLWMDHRTGNWSVTWDSETQITGHEGYAIVRIPGTHTSISFDYTAAENYANFMFGIAKERDCDEVPLIITNPMLRNRARQ